MRRFVIVDVFAEAKYAGNQLAVVLDCDGLDSAAMQSIARETNYSETTFVTSQTAQGGAYAVRIFTPAGEIPFAGHPTLGTAWVIRDELAPGAARIDLALGIGRVGVDFRADGDGEVVWMTAPEPELRGTFPPEKLAPVIGLTVADLDPQLPVQEVAVGVTFTFLPVRDLAAVQRARFDSAAYERAADLAFPPGFFLFCRQALSPDNHVHARLFANAFGIAEDPATGSANACLGRYLLDHLGGESLEVRVEQGYEIHRPSLLRVTARRVAEKVVVVVGGRVIPSARGELV